MTGVSTAPVDDDAAQASDVPVDFGIDFRGNEDGIVAHRFGVFAGEGSLSGQATLGFGLADLLADPDRLADASLEVHADLAAVDLAHLGPELGVSDLGGEVTGALAITGTVKAPVPALDVSMIDGFFRVPRGPRLADLNAHINVTENTAQLVGLVATIGAGPVDIQGSFEVPGNLLSDWRDGKLSFQMSGDDVLLHRRDGLKLRGDLDLAASGPPNAIEVTGKVALHSSKLISRIPYVVHGRVGGEAVREGIVLEGVDLGPDVRVNLDVAVTTTEPIAVKTNVLRGPLNTFLSVGGPLSAPTIEGKVSSDESTLILPGCRFKTTTMLVEFDRESPRFPKLNIVGSGRRHGFDVQMVVRGRYDQPEIVFSSNPPLPADELAVLVTTGARPQTLRRRGARGAATMVGSYLAEELADWLFGSESTEAKESFLERFTLETGTEISADGTESVVVEFRMVDRLFLQGERDVYEDVNFGLVYRVRFK